MFEPARRPKICSCSSQFDMLVTFMEQHGDISKPSSHARGKIACLGYWEELAQLLNSDGSGDSKTVDKWKKVWSDYKNNTKKKAARLHRAASGTGGGPAMHIKLSDLELRVLNMIGAQVATGLAVAEAGLAQGVHIPPQVQCEEVPQDSNEPAPATSPIPAPAGSPLPTLTRALSSPPLMFVEEEIQNTQPWNEPGPSTSYVAQRTSQATPITIIPSYVQARLEDNTGMLSPTRPSSQVHVVQAEPSQAGPTTPRHSRQRRLRGSPRRPVRPPRTEEAAQQFLQAEEYWRNFKMEQHRDYMELKREQNRIREMELKIHSEWQAVGLRALDAINKLVDKFCKD